jgi:hypothetical protein
MPSRTPPATTLSDEAKEQIADAVIERFVSRHPELRQGSIVTEIPPPIKWVGIMLGGTMTAAVTAGLFWLVATVSEMQVTLARMDERIGGWTSMNESRYSDLEKRVAALEESDKEDRKDARK